MRRVQDSILVGLGDASRPLDKSLLAIFWFGVSNRSVNALSILARFLLSLFSLEHFFAACVLHDESCRFPVYTSEELLTSDPVMDYQSHHPFRTPHPLFVLKLYSDGIREIPLRDHATKRVVHFHLTLHC